MCGYKSNSNFFVLTENDEDMPQIICKDNVGKQSEVFACNVDVDQTPVGVCACLLMLIIVFDVYQVCSFCW